MQVNIDIPSWVWVAAVFLIVGWGVATLQKGPHVLIQPTAAPPPSYRPSGKYAHADETLCKDGQCQLPGTYQSPAVQYLGNKSKCFSCEKQMVRALDHIQQQPGCKENPAGARYYGGIAKAGWVSGEGAQ